MKPSSRKANAPAALKQVSGIAAGAFERTIPALSRAKKWVFSVIAFVLFPILLLAMAETALRVSGYGYRTSFLVPIQINGRDFLVENAWFGLRFFPPELARSPPPIVMPAVKSPGTYRIFVIGESAALGDPRPAFGPGRYLQAMLEQRHPGVKFEVIAAAMTAINSHALLPIVRECAVHHPDAWVVYMGNNEMVGPFGAASVFGARAPPAGYVRLSLALQRLRLGQWIVSTARKWAGRSSGEAAWGGMKMFLESKVAPGDPGKETVYANFRKNLDGMLKTMKRSGAPVILNTVAVNLKDCAPFATVTNAAPDAESLFVHARALLTSSNNVELERAASLFSQARDADALPFRADSRINAVVAEAARRHGTAFLDAAALFATNSAAGIPGREFFLEHVHFDFSGSYLLARAWAKTLEAALGGLRNATSPQPWPSQGACDDWLGLTDWNRVTVCEQIVRRLGEPPFVNQVNHDEQMELARARVRQTRSLLTAERASAASQVYRTALQRSPDDYWLHENYAEFLEARAQLAEAEAEWLRVLNLTPHHHVGWFQAGRIAFELRKLREAQPLLEKAVALRPDLAEGWFELGRLHAWAGRHDLALKQFERELELAPTDPRAYYQMGRAQSKLNRRDQALSSFARALQLKPDYWEARYSLGEELAFAGRRDEACRELEEVIRIRPEYPMAHFNLGVALFQTGDRAGALRQFEETLRFDPQNRLAAEYVARLRQ